jgi:hypothetical protein
VDTDHFCQFVEIKLSSLPKRFKSFRKSHVRLLRIFAQTITYGAFMLAGF